MRQPASDLDVAIYHALVAAFRVAQGHDSDPQVALRQARDVFDTAAVLQVQLERTLLGQPPLDPGPAS